MVILASDLLSEVRWRLTAKLSSDLLSEVTWPPSLSLIISCFHRFNILLEDCIEDAKEAQHELEMFDIQLGKMYQNLEKYQTEHASLLQRG